MARIAKKHGQSCLVIKVDRFHAEAIGPAPFNYPPVSLAPPTRKFQMARTEKGFGSVFIPPNLIEVPSRRVPVLDRRAA